MPNKGKQPISKRFVTCITAVSLFLIIYSMAPNKYSYIEEPPIEEELYEFNSIPQEEAEKLNRLELLPDRITNKQEEIRQNYNINPDSGSSIAAIEDAVNKPAPDYNALLDELKNLPNHSLHSTESILNKLLMYKGYPNNLIKLVLDKIDQSLVKTKNSFLIAAFDFSSGEMKINQDNIYNLDIKVLIAILAHETDHFDKLAKLCKSMGSDNFFKLLEENGINNINKRFWEQSSYWADTNNFDAKEAKEALIRYLHQDKMDNKSIYTYFYKLAETMRNPFEISAYKESDYVYDYYNIPIEEGPTKRITKAFNETDWEIYNQIKNDYNLKNSRTALFDYYFGRAIVKNYPILNNIYINNINQKDGNLNDFWNAFKKTIPNLFEGGQLDEQNVKSVIKLLNLTKEEVKTDTNKTDISNALKYEIKTLSAEIMDENTINTIKNSIDAYLKYIKQNNIYDPKSELDFILTLICIENKYYTNSSKEISLYYTKLPESLSILYGTAKNNKYKFIYNNEEFKKGMQNINTPDNTESKYLISLLNSHRIKI